MIIRFKEFVEIMEAFPADPDFKPNETDFNKILKTQYYIKQKTSGERRYTNEPSYKHPIGVYEYVKKYDYNANVDMLMAALLHDVIEDEDDMTVKEIRQLFGDKVAGYVDELTNDPSELQQLGKTQYLINKINNMSPNAKTIKLCDRLHNLKDLEIADEKWVSKYGKQTHDILDNLEESKLNHTHKTIIKDIRKKLSVHNDKIFSK